MIFRFIRNTINKIRDNNIGKYEIVLTQNHLKPKYINTKFIDINLMMLNTRHYSHKILMGQYKILYRHYTGNDDIPYIEKELFVNEQYISYVSNLINEKWKNK